MTRTVLRATRTANERWARSGVYAGSGKDVGLGDEALEAEDM